MAILNRIKLVCRKEKTGNGLQKKLEEISATVSKWMTNTTQPHFDMLIKLSKDLEVEMQDLVRM